MAACYSFLGIDRTAYRLEHVRPTVWALTCAKLVLFGIDNLLLMEKPAQHIIRNNLIGLLVAAVVLGLLGHVTNFGSIVLFAFGYGIQAFVNLILGVVYVFKNTNQATDKNPAPYFLSALLVLLIGFGACSGMLMLGGSLGSMH